MGFSDDLAGELPPPVRLAIGYAPASARPLWQGFFALDRRFANLLSGSREPMLAQMRLAWWREVLAKPSVERPAGEPLLAALAPWDERRDALAALADGWEALIGDAPLEPAAFAALAGARAGVVAALIHLSGEAGMEGAAQALGYRWALLDVASHLSDPVERDRVHALIRAAGPVKGPVPRLLRPIGVLATLAERSWEEGRAIGGLGDFAVALRMGLIGR